MAASRFVIARRRRMWRRINTTIAVIDMILITVLIVLVTI